MLNPGRRKSRTAVIIPSDVVVTGIVTAKRKAVPKALREQVWRTHIGDHYIAKCAVTWCTNEITPFDYEVGHNIPHSQGGELTIQNLRPICGRCNKSMGDKYTIDEWNRLLATEVPAVSCGGCCFSFRRVGPSQTVHTTTVSVHSGQSSPQTTSASSST